MILPCFIISAARIFNNCCLNFQLQNLSRFVINLSPICKNNKSHSENKFIRWFIRICIFQVLLVKIWSLDYNLVYDFFIRKHLYMRCFEREKYLWRSVAFSKVLFLVILLKLIFLHECFLRFLNCINSTKSQKK